MAIEMVNQVAIDRGAIANQCQELAALITRHTHGKGNGFHQTDIDQLEFQRESSVSTALHAVTEPILAILIQGKKEALLGEEIYRYSASQYLVVSVDLPLSGFVVEATPDKFAILSLAKVAQV
jgi:AraC-type transcriptional regulator N-terminus